MSVNFFLTKTETLTVGDAGAIFSTICRERKEKIDDGKICVDVNGLNSLTLI